jgi:hypothetical protein
MPNAQDQMDPQPLDYIEFTDPEAPTRFTWRYEDAYMSTCLYVIQTTPVPIVENTWRCAHPATCFNPISNRIARARLQSLFIADKIRTGIDLADELLASFLRSRSPCR